MSTLEARIAEVIAAHNPEAHYYIDGGGEGHMECRGCDGKWASFHGFYAHQAAMLAPIIREAQAEALREAVSDFESSIGVGELAELSKRGPLPWGHIEEAWEHQGPYMDWLRTRADNLEAS